MFVLITERDTHFYCFDGNKFLLFFEKFTKPVSGNTTLVCHQGQTKQGQTKRGQIKQRQTKQGVQTYLDVTEYVARLLGRNIIFLVALVMASTISFKFKLYYI